MNRQRALPPVTAVGMTSLALVVIGGIYLTAKIPGHVPLAPAIVLLVLSVLLMAGNALSLGRVKGFAWATFAHVFRWAGLAYLVSAAMIEYAFLRNGLRGGPLVVLTLSLLVYTIHVPFLIAFTVARYADTGPSGATVA